MLPWIPRRGPEGKSDPSIRLNPKIAARERLSFHPALARLLLTQLMVSTKCFEVGDEVYITLPFAAGQAPVETAGKIAGSAEDTVGRFYGVEYGRNR